MMWELVPDGGGEGGRHSRLGIIQFSASWRDMSSAGRLAG